MKDEQGQDILDQGHIGSVNPYRYRGYRYDKEISTYYLQSRYYNPDWGRFINGDGLISTGQGLLSHNMYTYCNNNPIMHEDQSGQSLTFAIGAGLLLIIGMAGPVLQEAGNNLADSISQISISATKTSTKTQTIKKANPEPKNQTVYVLKNEFTKKVEYVGRTIDAEKREKAHLANQARKHLVLERIKWDLTKTEARGLEQVYIIHYSTLNRSKKMSNQINGIAFKNPMYNMFINAALPYINENEVYVGGN